MQTNLEETLQWLRLNPSAMTTGFEYAHVASTNMSKPTVFNFETSKTRAAHNCALSSIGTIGMIDLDVYRTQEVTATHDPSTAHRPPPSAVTTNTRINATYAVPLVTPAANAPSPSSGYGTVQPALDDIPDEMFLNIDVEGKLE